MFSVVIPVYNKQEFINNCLESVRLQDFNKFEIIIVNDGSTDNSLKLIEEFKNSNQNLDISIVDIDNMGVSFARNMGISKTKYEFICFLDADDFWYKNHLMSIYSLIKDFPEAAIFSSGYIVKKESKQDLLKVCDINRGYVDNFFKSSLKNDVITSSTVCIMKKCFDKVFFPEGITLTEDLYVWTSLALYFDIAYNNTVTVEVNQFLDNSRSKRYTQLPYVVVYYHKNVNPDLIKYISYVSFAHLYAFKVNLNIKNYLKLLILTLSFNKILFLISIFMFFMPVFLIDYMKKFKTIFFK